MSEFHEQVLDEQPKLITIQIAVPDGRNGQVCLATNLDQWSPQSTIDGMLDKLMAAAERQRAKITLPELKHELDGNRSVLEENRIRLAEQDAGFAEQVAIYKEKRQTAQHAHDEIFDAAQRDHYGTGRQGEFKPRGTVLTKVNTLARAVKDIDAAVEKTTSEHLVARSQLVNEIHKREQSVEILTRRHAELEAMINGTGGEPDLRSSAQHS